MTWKWRFPLAACAIVAPLLAQAQTSNYPNGGFYAGSNQGYASAAITPSNSTKISVTRAIFNGNATACDIAMQLNGDTAAITWSNVPSGAILPVQAVLVKSTGTTCSNLIAIY